MKNKANIKIQLTNTKAMAFYDYVRNLTEQGENIMDIIMDWSEKNNNDIDFVIELIKRDKELKQKLEVEAENRKMFKVKESKLVIQ